MKRALLFALLVALATMGGAAWVLGTEDGLRIALSQVVKGSQGRLIVEEPRGALAGRVEIARIAYRGDGFGIELRAPGYKTVSFTAEIVQDRAITYRAVLERDPEASAPTPIVIKPAAAPGSSTIYMIAGCYLGNVMPTAATLRPGCDINKLTKFEP